MYHNRGTSTFAGENSTYGDFPGATAQGSTTCGPSGPQVVHGMEDIYKTWVSEAGVDGFRIDTVKHVNLEFWQRFGPTLQGYAATIGQRRLLHVRRGLRRQPRVLSRLHDRGRLQSTVDFGFQAGAQSFA